MHKVCKKINSVIIVMVSSILLVLLLGGCVTVDSASREPGAGSQTPVYYGEGNGDSAQKAMVAARRNAIRKAADDLLGNASARTAMPELDKLFAGIENFGPYLLKDSQSTVDSRSGEDYYYHLGMKVNLETLANTLESSGISGGQLTADTDAVYRLKDQMPPAAAVASRDTRPENKDGYREQGSGDEMLPIQASELSAGELAVISEYIGRLTYMVFFDEATAVDSKQSRSAVVRANRFLDDNGYDYVDLSSIETIRREQFASYEEETGNAVSIMQWIAHKLNADIYIELSLDTLGESEGGRYYGSAELRMKIYAAATFGDRGSVENQTAQPVLSKVSVDVALSKAVDSVVSNGMLAAIDEAESQTARAASNGFKYILTMSNTQDSGIARDFEKKLGSRAKSVKRLSFSPEESVFEVYLIGDIADLEDIVYETAKSISGLEGLMLVMQRRNSIVFDTGM